MKLIKSNKLLEVLLLVPILLFHSDHSFLLQLDNSKSEPLVPMPQVTGIKKLPLLFLLLQIMEVKLLLSNILSTKYLTTVKTTLWFSIFVVLFLKVFSWLKKWLLINTVDTVELFPQLNQLPVQPEDS